ncbi:spermidine/putrescine ABC transporter substrate-binding protein [Leucobacter chinensis]|uniref:spermidine/putrescine ABC transporter substrate-binding protein n=1 Tax=Leucobacter chinensis TaxID=2851010 RepID=UPI001C211C54
MTGEHLAARVAENIQAWEGWLASWEPPLNRARPRVCRKCTNSPLAAAAGFARDTPHQVVHALVSRMHRLIDAEVDMYTNEHLPLLQAELEGAAIWNSGGYDPGQGLDVEYDGVDHDAVEAPGAQPFLFTFAELQQAEKPEPALPRPPLTEAEKRQLKLEIDVADRQAASVGQELCFLLVEHQPGVRQAVKRFVDPQIEALLEQLSRNLEAPGN